MQHRDIAEGALHSLCKLGFSLPLYVVAHRGASQRLLRNVEYILNRVKVGRAGRNPKALGTHGGKGPNCRCAVLAWLIVQQDPTGRLVDSGKNSRKHAPNDSGKEGSSHPLEAVAKDHTLAMAEWSLGGRVYSVGRAS